VGVSVRLVGGLELDAGSPAVVEEVLHLAGDLLVGEGGEEGESFEEPKEEDGRRRRSAAVFRRGREAEKTGFFRNRAWEALFEGYPVQIGNPKKTVFALRRPCARATSRDTSWRHG
jgi:hypothetical protein